MEEEERMFSQAAALESNGEREEALSKYTEYINRAERPSTKSQTNSKLALAYNNRGFLRYLKVDFDEAVEDYTKSVSIDPNSAVTYYNRGTIHYRLGRFDDAIADMKRSLSLDPNFTAAQTGLHSAEKDILEKLNRGW